MAKDIIIAIIVIFVFAVGFFSFHHMFNISIDKVLNVTVVNESQAAVDSFNQAKTLSNRLDYVIFMVMLLLLLGIMITSWFIGGHPILMFVYFLIAVVAVILASVFHYVWDSISQASIFGTTILAFPITNHILSHLEIYTPVLAFIAMITMFAKPFLTNEQQ